MGFYRLGVKSKGFINRLSSNPFGQLIQEPTVHPTHVSAILTQISAFEMDFHTFERMMCNIAVNDLKLTKGQACVSGVGEGRGRGALGRLRVFERLRLL